MALGNHEKKVTEGLVRADFPGMVANGAANPSHGREERHG